MKKNKVEKLGSTPPTLEGMILRAARLMAGAYIDSGLSYRYFDEAMRQCETLLRVNVTFDKDALSYALIKRAQEEISQEKQQQ